MAFEDADDESALDEPRALMVNLIVRVPAEMKARITALAQARDRDPSKLIRYIFRETVPVLEEKWAAELERFKKKGAPTKK